MSTESDDAKLQQNICPVCNIARKGHANKRRALQEHLRRSKDVSHIMWYQAEYRKHFTHGGDRTAEQVNEDTVREAMYKAFGEEWVKRVHFSNQISSQLLSPI